jgi:RNA polymerase sigma-70 factor (ECF subfamily)
MIPSEEDFEALYTRTRDQILGYLLRRCAHPEDAADLLAEVYLVAWRRRHDLPAGDEARLWLYGVARHALANHRRGTLRRRELGQRLRSEILAANLVAAGPEERDRDLLPMLRAALHRLSDDDRELVLLAAWEQLDATQIAEVMGLSAGTVRTRLHRARTRLRQHLARATRNPSQPVQMSVAKAPP